MKSESRTFRNTRFRIIGAIAVVTTTALVIAGCSSSGSGAAGTTPGTSAGGATGGGSTSSATSGSGGGGAANCPSLTIGYSGALTGNNAYTGKTQKQAVDLAVADHNKKSGVCQVQVKEYDDQADPGQTPALMTKAAQDKSVVAMVGPNYSSTMLVGGPILNEAGIPLITSAATDSTLADKGWTVFHRSEANNLNQAANDAKYMVDTLKVKKAYVVDNQATYGQGLAKAIVDNLTKLGATSQTGSINPQSQDYSATVQSIKSYNPDLVYCGCYQNDGASLLKQLRTAGVTAVYYGTGSFTDPAYVTLAGQANANGSYYSTSAKDPGHLPGAATFADEWKAAYGGTPPAYTPETYDAADAFLRAIDAGNYTRDAINKWLTTCDFQGVSGEIKFTANGNLAEGATAIYTIKDGASVFVTTAKA